ncbi:Glu-tRNA(Gln) amidotransferase subunit GatD [Candidatus Woesearchaeota archaeon]|nr:Glu-tRNA(Gln) amidotransferase subunit GatD [Candidatus Woesearchaeota archaeon]
MKPKSGDVVRVSTKEEVFEGILMPRPEILDKNVTVVKLFNGYNVGVDNKKIKKIELLKKYSPKIFSKSPLKKKKGLPNVTVLSTGGTISSKIDYKTGGVYADYTAEDFVEIYPGLADIANLKAKKIMSIMSEDMASKEWILIAKEVEKELNSGADGVVVTQGTDTLHFTSAALSFLLKDLSKPVILTASQRSIDRGSSDAHMNLVCAITSAAKFDAAEVMSCLHGTTNDDYCLLIRGTKVRKMHTTRRDAFRPINESPLAKVYENGKIKILNKNFKKRGESKTTAFGKFEKKVALVAVYPGMEPEIIDFYLKKGYKGLVLSATALGHVPTENSSSNLLPGIKKAISKGVNVVIASQTVYGRVHPYVYTNLRKLSIQLNCIFVEDTTPETAYIKLGFVLGQTNNHKKVKELMLSNLAGEITERSDDKSFLY